MMNLLQQNKKKQEPGSKIVVYWQQNKKARAEDKKCHAKTMMSTKAEYALK
jgi:hypothetical protein